MTRKARTIITDFGGELEAMIQDNQMTSGPADTGSAPPTPAPTPTPARAKAKPSPGPAEAGQGAASGAAGGPAGAAARKNYSIRVPFHEIGAVSEARKLASQYGISEAKALSPHVKTATATLRERLQSGALDGLGIGRDRRKPIAVVPTSISLSDADLEAIRAKVDPAGLYSNAKVLALTYAQIISGNAA